MGKADQLPVTRPIRTIVLTEVAFIGTTIGILLSRPHPAYVYVVTGLLGLILQALAIVSTVRVVRRRSSLTKVTMGQQ